MLQSILKSTGVFMLIIIGFILILFLPREKELTFLSAFQIEADYPFSFELYVERIEDFTGHILTEKGLGKPAPDAQLVMKLEYLLRAA